LKQENTFVLYPVRQPQVSAGVRQT
jgi:hypothetical protein